MLAWVPFLLLVGIPFVSFAALMGMVIVQGRELREANEELEAQVQEFQHWCLRLCGKGCKTCSWPRCKA